MTTTSPPEELDTQVPDKQGSVEFQLFTSLLPATRGWFANHSLQPTPVGAGISADAGHVIGPAWLSLGRYATT
jgi:hypothetical protein